MPLRSRLLAVALVVAGLLVPAVVGRDARADGAHDYAGTRGLTVPAYETVTEELKVAMRDGVELYVEVTRPKVAGKWGVILEASPYHGTLADREGTRIFPYPTNEDGDKVGLTGYFARRGYAVVMVDLRGTAKSGGCLDHLGPNDASDLKAIIEWAATRPWSNGRVGMTGHSYVGATTIVAAAQRPRGLVTIVPSAGLASMYDHQFQAGVPYLLQWAGPMEAYEELAIERDLPGGERFGEEPTGLGCGAANSSITAGESQLSGAYSDWHAVRDWADAAAAAPIPVFNVHGVNDDAARIPAMDWFNRRGNRPGDKLWIGQWSHGSGCCPNRRGAQWVHALHAWFDHHLLQKPVDTGPAVEAFLADGTLAQVRNTYRRTETLERPTWPRADGEMVLYPEGGGGLAASRPAAGSQSFAGDPTGVINDQTGGATFSTKAFKDDVVFLGVPDLTLVASVTAPRVHLIANVYDQSMNGTRRRITPFAINPELRHGLGVPEPVIAGTRYTMDPPGFAMAHHLRAGHRLVFRVTASDPDKVPLFSVDPHITVFTGPDGTVLRLPVVAARLKADTVPLGVDGP
ncbi:MAG TPA: CocE/NonD family hydrolase [Acidimicrobiales bacterium]|nr:CocE/NonD family hydrolase [Acidimicrobiales bacterium]